MNHLELQAYREHAQKRSRAVTETLAKKLGLTPGSGNWARPSLYFTGPCPCNYRGSKLTLRIGPECPIVDCDTCRMDQARKHIERDARLLAKHFDKFGEVPDLTA